MAVAPAMAENQRQAIEPPLQRSKSFMDIDTNNDGLIDVDELLTHLLQRGVEEEEASPNRTRTLWVTVRVTLPPFAADT